MSSNVLYGRRTVQEYLAAGATGDGIQAVYLSESFPKNLRDSLEASVSPTLFRSMPRKQLDEKFPDVNHQGIVIQFHTNFTPVHRARKNWKAAVTDGRGLLLVLDRIQDPQNLGGIIRTAEAFGVQTLFITGKGAGLTPAVERVSAGAVFHLDIFTLSNLGTLIEEAQRADYWICTTEPPAPSEASQPEHSKSAPIRLHTGEFHRLPSADKILLLLSHEGSGTKPLAQKKADYELSIPLKGQTASLNVGVATGILLDRLLGPMNPGSKI